jgi:hypothetical protein
MLDAEYSLSCTICNKVVAYSKEKSADMAMLEFLDKGWREATVCGKNLVGCPKCIAKMGKRRF